MLVISSCSGVPLAVARRERSAEEGGKGPQGQCKPPLTIEARPVREVRGVERLGFWAHHLIDLEGGAYVTSLPRAVPTHPSGPGGTQGRRSDRQILTRGRPSPARAQLTVASFSLSAEATGPARLVGGKMGPLQVGHW